MDLNALISHLQRLRKSHGGNAEVYLGDRKVLHMGWTIGGFEIAEAVNRDGEERSSEITINPIRV